MRLRYPSSLITSWLLATLLGCGDDGSSEAGDGDGETATDDEVGSESESSDSSSSTDDGESTSDESSSDGTEGTEDTTTDGETDEADATGEGTDTIAEPCVDITDAQECDDAVGCMPISGQPLEGGNGNLPCLGESVFLGCIDETICDDAHTWFCMGMDQYLTPSGCGPDGWQMCQGPPNIDSCP